MPEKAHTIYLKMSVFLHLPGKKRAKGFLRAPLLKKGADDGCHSWTPTFS